MTRFERMRDDSIYQPQFTRSDVKCISTQDLYRGFVQVEAIVLRHRLFSHQGFSKEITREIVHRREAAGVFVHDPILKKFLLIEQFRAGALNSIDTPWHLEVIAGLIDDGEDAITCLKREALEEADCTIDELEFIYRYYPSTGASDEIFNFYVATADLSQCGGVHGAEDEGEDIKVHLFDYDDLLGLIKSGYVRNAPLIIALQWFQLYLSQQSLNHRGVD